MPLERFIPKSPDPFIRNSQDFEVAKFGHLNTIIEYVNTYVVTDSLQLAGTGPLTSTARYITDSLGNTSTLAISTVNIGVGTSTPAGKVDIVSDGGGQLLFSRYGGQPQIIIRRSQGTFAAPTAVTGGASSVLAFQNYDGTSFGTSAQIQSVPTENQTPTAKGASLALNVVQAGTTSVINGLIVSGGSTNPGSVSITTNFSAATARLSIWQTALSSTLPYFNIQETGGGELLEFSNAGNLLVGSGSPSDTARVSIKGSGSTSATTSLLVQNSSASPALTITDDKASTFNGPVTIGSLSETNANSRSLIINGGFGNTSSDKVLLTLYAWNNLAYGVGSKQWIYFGGGGLDTSAKIGGINLGNNNYESGLVFNTTSGGSDTEVMRITNTKNVGIGTTSPTAKLQVKGSGLTSATNALFVENSSSSPLLTIADDGNTTISGSGNVLKILNTIQGKQFTFTPSFATSAYGGYLTHTDGNITLGASLGTDNGSGLGIILGAPSGTRTALLQVKGTGSTSATTSLLVQNSAGTQALKVRDDGKTAFGNSSIDCTITGTTGSGNKFEFYAFNGYDIIDGFGNVLVTGLGDTIRLPRKVGIGFNTQNHASAILQVDSTTQGFLPPRMSTAQRTAIVSPAAGLIVYDTDTNKSYTYDGTAWQAHW